MARKILRKDKMMWLVKDYLPKNYKKLSDEEQEQDMNCALVKAHMSYKQAREKCAWKPDDGDFSDDEDDEIVEVRAKVEETKVALKKAALAAFYRNSD